MEHFVNGVDHNGRGASSELGHITGVAAKRLGVRYLSCSQPPPGPERRPARWLSAGGGECVGKLGRKRAREDRLARDAGERRDHGETAGGLDDLQPRWLCASGATARTRGHRPRPGARGHHPRRAEPGTGQSGGRARGVAAADSRARAIRAAEPCSELGIDLSPGFPGGLGRLRWDSAGWRSQPGLAPTMTPSRSSRARWLVGAAWWREAADQLVGVGIGCADARPFGQVGGGDRSRSEQAAAEQRQDGTRCCLECGGRRATRRRPVANRPMRLGGHRDRRGRQRSVWRAG